MPALPKMMPGLFLVEKITNPYGKMSGGIDISPMLDSCPGQWMRIVVAGPAADPRKAALLDEGFAVYVPLNIEPMVVGEHTYGIIHEGAVKGFLAKGEYEATGTSSTLEVMKEMPVNSDIVVPRKSPVSVN